MSSSVAHLPETYIGVMLLVACVLAGLAALVHVYIFVLESVRWTDPATRRVFGTTEETAAITAPLAYNQGFYNLFLAIGTAVGIALVPSDKPGCLALIAFGTGSMLAAALVLVTSDRSKIRAAVVQGLLPLLALLALLVHALG
jgi:putative membrane protein